MERLSQNQNKLITQPISNRSNMKTNALKTTSKPLKLLLSAP